MARIGARSNGLARRLGFRGREAAVVGCVVVTLVLAGAGVLAAIALQDGFGIARAGGQGVLQPEASEPAGADVDSANPDGEDQGPQEVALYVHVDGAVENPGVYVIRGVIPRVGQAVARAGGLTEDADTTTINLAAPLTDGQKIYVPHEGESVSEKIPGMVGASPSPSSELININTATAEELQSLPGVGEVTAAAIIEERERGGPFLSPEDIMRVSGIGEKRFERMRDYIGV